MRTRIRAARLAIENDSILLIKHESDSDEFWIPSSGGVEDSETFEECVIREMREETGLVPTVDRLMYLREFTQTGTDIHHVALFFRAKVNSLSAVTGSDHEFGPEDQQIIGVEWIPKDDR
jgi:ADP-ribose pyrophosphatase YjhB (NUDIX family)